MAAVALVVVATPSVVMSIISGGGGGGDDDGDEEEDDDGGYGKKNKPRGARKTTNARDAAERGSSSLSSSSPHGPINVYRLPTLHNNKYGASNVAFHSIDHHWSESHFVTSSLDVSVQVWDPKQSAPTCTFDDLWGSDDNDVVGIVKGRVSHEADAARLLRGVHLRSQVCVVRERQYKCLAVEGAHIREDWAAESTGGDVPPVQGCPRCEVRAPAEGEAHTRRAEGAEEDQEGDACNHGAEGEEEEGGGERCEAF